MTTIAIPLSDERVTQLRLRAEQAGLAPEEFLRRRVEASRLLRPGRAGFGRTETVQTKSAD
jgi:hypothetical protein